MAIDFGKLNSVPMDSVQRPPSAPAGTYFGVVSKYKFAETRFRNEETGQPDGALVLEIKPTEASEDIELPSGYRLQGKTFFFEQAIIDANGAALAGQYYVKQLMDALGISTSGRGFGECVPDLVGAHVMFDLTSREDKRNPGVFYNDVRKLRARAA